jgi:hypothetical protein
MDDVANVDRSKGGCNALPPVLIRPTEHKRGHKLYSTAFIGSFATAGNTLLCYQCQKSPPFCTLFA